MAEIVNLRLARKAKMRAEKTVAADRNRTVHGRTAGERTRDRLEAERLARAVDGSRIERD